MKTAILSNVNLDLLARYFKPAGEQPEFYIAGFNQYAQELTDPASQLYQFGPDVVIVHLNGAALFAPDIFNPFSTGDPQMTARHEAENFFGLVQNAAQKLPKTLFLLNSIVLPPENVLGSLEYNSPFSLKSLEQGFNARLSELKQKTKFHNIIISQWDSVVYRSGCSGLFDIRYWYLGRMPYSLEGLDSLAKLYENTLSAALGKNKKLLALDLDNTLWGGIIGEDGLDGIQLGEDGIGKAYRDFQRLVKTLKAKGILLALVSKNNLNDAKEVFEKHPMMILSLDDFAAVKVNWQSKTANLLQLAKELNLGLDSFVLIDDNPRERMEVASELPQVEVPDFPSDPALLPEWFVSLNSRYFDKLFITEEDLGRSTFYKTEYKRKELQESAGSLENFLKKLEMQTVIGLNSEIMVPRIAQLTQRTNQFNLTTRRYSDTDIAKFMRDGSSRIYDLELIDRFGSNGVVGVIIAGLEGSLATIDTFLLSCRVIGRTVEDAFFGYVAQDLVNSGIAKIVGVFRPTPKNSLAKNVYKNLNFTIAQTDDNGNETWILTATQNLPKIPAWIKVRKRADNEAQ
jgi:FkbH-like protein